MNRKEINTRAQKSSVSNQCSCLAASCHWTSASSINDLRTTSRRKQLISLSFPFNSIRTIIFGREAVCICKIRIEINVRHNRAVLAGLLNVNRKENKKRRTQRLQISKKWKEGIKEYHAKEWIVYCVSYHALREDIQDNTGYRLFLLI